MNYDEIKQEELVSDNIEETTKLANTLLESIVVYIENSHTQSPLAQFYNLMALLEKMDDIIEQTHNAALDYIRVREMKDPSVFSHHTMEEEAKTSPLEEKDGITYQWVRWANFRNLATKDKVLNSLIISEKETKAALNRIEAKITKRIGELRATKEFKKAKPTSVSEIINVKLCEHK